MAQERRVAELEATVRGGASEYKDIYVEENPKSDQLLTVR